MCQVFEKPCFMRSKSADIAIFAWSNYGKSRSLVVWRVLLNAIYFAWGCKTMATGILFWVLLRANNSFCPRFLENPLFALKVRQKRYLRDKLVPWIAFFGCSACTFENPVLCREMLNHGLGTLPCVLLRRDNSFCPGLLNNPVFTLKAGGKHHFRQNDN